MATTLSVGLGVLSHRVQRKVLVALTNHNPQDDTPIDSDGLEFDDVAVERLFDLRHFHLPELESKGFVNYDREDHILTKGPDFDEIKPVLELIDENRDKLPDDWL